MITTSFLTTYFTKTSTTTQYFAGYHMSSNEEIYNKIQESLQAARDALQLKTRITSDIVEVLSMLSELTNDAVSFEIKDNSGNEPSYRFCQKLIYIEKKSNSYYSFVLCGYSIDELSGYPVSLEDENKIMTCNDDMSLKTAISELITDKNIAMKIINLISADDIPF